MSKMARLVLWSCLAFVTIAVSLDDSDAVKSPIFHDELDCGMRRLFLAQAKKAVQWRRDMSDVHNALELESRCGDTYGNSISMGNDSSSRTGSQDETDIESVPKRSFFVCPVKGRDSHPGNETHPFFTIHRALEAVRSMRNEQKYNSKGPKRWTIVLRHGIHYLQKTIVLTPEDSNITIKPAPKEKAWISGGILINSVTAGWKLHSKDVNIWVANLTTLPKDHPVSSITGLFTLEPHERMTLARYPNANVEEWDAPGRYVPQNTPHDWLFPPFGMVPRFDFVNLTMDPNPTGAVKNDSSLPPYNMYGTGQGGACATVWGDLPSYWCSNVSAGGWAEVDQAAALAGRLNLPRGLVLYPNDSNGGDSFVKRVGRWSNPRGAIFHVSHTQGWAWHMFNVSHVQDSSKSTTIHFDKGGWQGGRNWQCKDADGHLSNCNGDDKKLQSGDWYVEGVLEELDAPGEFYYNATTQLLYFYPDCSSSMDVAEDESEKDTASLKVKRKRRRNLERRKSSCHVPDLVATNLQTLIKIEGTLENPVRGVRLLGLGFRDAAKTYMEQWSAPSGGDWALYRGGAVHLEGADNTTISDCNFHRLDGNAIMLAGYCRHTHVARSEFSWIGDGAMATWGDTDGYNATKGDQPRFSLIEQNAISNVGLYQKQSSGWGQAKACQNVIRENVMFNLPRAAINFNDGLGGGNLVQGNVIFNTCRESGDHGPINSWDRMPFLTNTTGSAPSFRPLPTHTTRNIILANYGASQGFDNDDGSSWYHTHDNVFYSADGFKMDYGGHDSAFTNNLVYGEQCFGTGSFLKGRADKFCNNTCIVVGDRNQQNNVGTLYQCSLDGMNPTNNSYFTGNGNATWTCEGDQFTLSQMQQKGFEAGSSVGLIPDANTIISWAENILADKNWN